MSAQGMPPNLLALFAPRQPIPFMPPAGGHGKKPVYTGIQSYIQLFETDPPPPKEPFETPRERKERKKKEAMEEHRKKQEALIAEYDPNSQPCATKNPFATLFVGRISYETTEKKLKKEFERYGPVKKVKIITDLNGKSRGYAFIEFERESDLKEAYKKADGTKIDGRRVLVDVERARTVPKWIPRRLGGGKGSPRFSEPKKKLRVVPPPQIQGPPGNRPFGGRPSFGGGGYGGGFSGNARVSNGPPSYGGRDNYAGGPPRERGGYNDRGGFGYRGGRDFGDRRFSGPQPRWRDERSGYDPRNGPNRRRSRSPPRDSRRLRSRSREAGTDERR